MSTAASQHRPQTKNLAAQFNQSATEQLDSVIASVQDAIAPVWPLRDFVAVNPYGGFSSQKLLKARKRLQSLSSCEMFMPVSYYQGRFKQGKFGLDEIGQAVDEMVADGVPGAESLNANVIHQLLNSEADIASENEAVEGQSLRLISQHYDLATGTSNWTTVIRDELCKYCSMHYDEGQASWSSPFKELPLYQAWRSAAQLDRNVEILGLTGFRAFVSELPQTPEAAIFVLLNHSEVPQHLWSDYLLCAALSIPGWSAYTKFKAVESAKRGFESPDFAALLAMRLAYDVALSQQFEFRADHSELSSTESESEKFSEEALIGLTLLRANEIGFRKRLLGGIQASMTSSNSRDQGDEESDDSKRATQLAQMVFCIDVRSERLRRNLEAMSSKISTFGFAGFFGMPFEYVRVGDQDGTSQLPVLLDPKFKVYEGIRGDFEGQDNLAAEDRRSRVRQLRYLWKSFQTSAVSCFAFVETSGLFYSQKLLGRLLGRGTQGAEFDGVKNEDKERLGPSFRDLNRQGITTSHQIDLAESALRGVGITEDFAQLVVLCGHGAKTENNPLHAGLDCGACAGHSGEVNARFAAMLLNKPYVRKGLQERGISVPATTHFVAALHNTTTDEINFFDIDLVPESSKGFLAELEDYALVASQNTRRERLTVLPGKESSLIQRSLDWSEVRPEWGLTGNAAFVVGPRELTKSFSLEGESFLHSYDFRRDTDGKLLEQIMTAPLVVANWINMQYFASTVDQEHFGSGTKTIHNVVGKFGILSGNGGDLTTGLPWESIHNGTGYQHDPMRLLTVIEAPRDWVTRILADHQNVRELVVNGWVNLVVIDDGQIYRYTESGEWQ